MLFTEVLQGVVMSHPFLGGTLVLQIWVMSETLLLHEASDFLVFYIHMKITSIHSFFVRLSKNCITLISSRTVLSNITVLSSSTDISNITVSPVSNDQRAKGKNFKQMTRRFLCELCDYKVRGFARLRLDVSLNTM